MRASLLCFWLTLYAASSSAGELSSEESVLMIAGDVYEKHDVSAVARVGDWIVVASDEGGRVQILRLVANQLRVVRDVRLAEDEPEADFEAIAADGDMVYVLGSHSRVRKKVKGDRSARENRERLLDIDRQPTREVLFRFQLAPDGQVSRVERTSLMPILEKYPLLERFTSIPGKENGVDLEGLATRDGWLYAGFRGPVLRGNLVPVLKFRFASPVRESQLLLVDLAGSGIRAMAEVEGGFLILAGPVGDGLGEYTIHFWDGRDALDAAPDADGRRSMFKPLARISAPLDAKPEGLTVLREHADRYELLDVFDGVANGHPTRFSIGKKSP
ncbi:MAG: DUF3616 domain-containing protein [Planctomycetales bacterium]|nr:DUF3616 domain-containing protein [Planctomycetales bacterium]